MEKSLFDILYNLDTRDITQVNYQGVKYIPWANAWHKIKSIDPKAEYHVREFGETGTPFLSTQHGCFVYVTVTVKGESAVEWLPVMDGAGKAIPNPDARDINDNIKRCLVKALALLGFGLHAYEKDDIYAQPVQQRATARPTEQQARPAQPTRSAYPPITPPTAAAKKPATGF